MELNMSGLPKAGIKHINHFHAGGTCADDRAGRPAPATIPLKTIVARDDGTGSATTTLEDVTLSQLFDPDKKRYIALHARTEEGQGVPPVISCVDVVQAAGAAGDVSKKLPESGGPPPAVLFIVVAVWLLAILMWTLRMRERREARKRSSAWAAHYGKNYTRFDPYSRFEDYFLKAAPPEVGNSPDRIEIFAAARARRSALLPRRGLAISRVHNPEIRRYLRSASRTRRRRVQGTFPRDREEGGDR